MEDKRITKTKRALKSALLDLLTTQAFDVISITELCKIANVSRITFYTHYKDKFALLDDIFNDMLIIGKEGYHRRQEENNPENNLTQGYLNVLDSILSLYYERYDFFPACRTGNKSLPGFSILSDPFRHGRISYR